MTIVQSMLPLPTAIAAATGAGFDPLRGLEDRLRRCAAALADCPWRAMLRFLGAVAGVLALISAAPDIADGLERAAHWAAADAAAAVERAVLALAHAAGTAL